MRLYNNNFRQVESMHRQFNLHEPEFGPRKLTDEEYKFRIKAMFEELIEYMDAANVYEKSNTSLLKDQIFGYIDCQKFGSNDLENQFDALLDLAVFTMGTAERQNLPWDDGFKLVMDANMNKHLGSNGEKRGGFKRDLVKPKGWQAPKLAPLVVNKQKGLIILDGPDACGKTTLANYLKENYGAHIHHLTWTPELELSMDEYMLGELNSAIQSVKLGALVVIDRHFLSEWIYSEVFRGGTQWKGLHRSCLDMINRINGTIVSCTPMNKSKYLKHFVEVKEERPEMYGDMEAIYDLYNKVDDSLDFMIPNASGIKKFLRYDLFDYQDDCKTFIENELLPLVCHKRRITL